MLIDAHTHFRDEDWLLLPDIALRDDLMLLPNGDNPEECARLFALAEEHTHIVPIIPTCGIHPWKADRTSLEEMRPFLEECSIIGEIGLDNVWCDVLLSEQRQIFSAQLELAQRLGKAILLHTKGCEAEIAETIRPYTMHKLVHWYSAVEHLDAYLDQDCWFTVGPHPADPAVAQVARRVPLNRLLLETDGRAAVEWATGERITPDGLRRHLLRMTDWVAALRGVTPEWLERQMVENLNEFIGITPEGGAE